MLPHKLDELVQLMKLLDELYCMYKMNEGLGFTFKVNQLSTGTNYRISVNSNIACIEMLDIKFKGFHEFLDMFEDEFLHTTEIWDDVKSIFPSYWNHRVSETFVIRRLSASQSNNIDNTYQELSADTSLEPDIIDPIIFQNLTCYTMNEVLTQLISLKIYSQKKSRCISCTMKLDYRVLDILTEEEILELVQVIKDEIEYRKWGKYDNV